MHDVAELHPAGGVEVSGLDERVAVVARVLSAVDDALAEPVRAALDALARVQPAPGAEDDLAEAQEQLQALRARLAALTRLAEAQHPLQRSPVEVSDVLQSALAGLEADAGRVFAPPCELEVAVDARALASALRELAENALEASNGPVRLEAAQHGRELRLTVTGEGRWPAELDEACDPFWTTKPQSLGLGLAVAHAVAHAHGGRLEQVGGGVALVLPLDQSMGP